MTPAGFTRIETALVGALMRLAANATNAILCSDIRSTTSLEDERLAADLFDRFADFVSSLRERCGVFTAEEVSRELDELVSAAVDEAVAMIRNLSPGGDA